MDCLLYTALPLPGEPLDLSILLTRICRKQTSKRRELWLRPTTWLCGAIRLWTTFISIRTGCPGRRSSFLVCVFKCVMDQGLWGKPVALGTQVRWLVSQSSLAHSNSRENHQTFRVTSNFPRITQWLNVTYTKIVTDHQIRCPQPMSLGWTICNKEDILQNISIHFVFKMDVKSPPQSHKSFNVRRC